MKIATFNINGIKARIETVPLWLEASTPDVAVLQEIKSVDEGFPRQVFEDLGWRVETHGQKGFNGVAILSRLPLEDVTRGLPGDLADEQSRYIEATVIGQRAVRVCGLYLPNGNPAPGPKFDYKLAWMERLRQRALALLATEEPVVMLGDYNVIPQAEDAAKPRPGSRTRCFCRKAGRPSAGFSTWASPMRCSPHPTPGYTFWDYQAGRVGAEQRHPHRPCAAQPAGRRPADRRGHREEPARRRQALGPRAGLGGTGGLTGTGRCDGRSPRKGRSCRQGLGAAAGMRHVWARLAPRRKAAPNAMKIGLGPLSPRRPFGAKAKAQAVRQGLKVKAGVRSLADLIARLSGRRKRPAGVSADHARCPGRTGPQRHPARCRTGL